MVILCCILMLNCLFISQSPDDDDGNQIFRKCHYDIEKNDDPDPDVLINEMNR